MVQVVKYYSIRNNTETELHRQCRCGLGGQAESIGSCREVSLPVGEPITSSNEPDIRNDETYQGFTAEIAI